MDVRALSRRDMPLFCNDVCGTALSIEPLGGFRGDAAHCAQRHLCMRGQCHRHRDVYHHAKRVSDCDHRGQHRCIDWYHNVRLDVGGERWKFACVSHTSLFVLLLYESPRCQERKGEGCQGLREGSGVTYVVLFIIRVLDSM